MIKIVRGDITQQTTAAIVNAANTHLIAGSGVCGQDWVKGLAAAQSGDCATALRHGRPLLNWGTSNTKSNHFVDRGESKPPALSGRSES